MKAFLKKEWMEWGRTGRSLVLLLVFCLVWDYESCCCEAYAMVNGNNVGIYGKCRPSDYDN
ncbi:hypothetical protein IMSAGC018_00013 [Lachnospiraceae bacterium]|nr:hypothetical protein IMSAGC018_00013 [Lachnospiraceae bacterium]